jgi:hypothetical protein
LTMTVAAAFVGVVAEVAVVVAAAMTILFAEEVPLAC